MYMEEVRVINENIELEMFSCQVTPSDRQVFWQKILQGMPKVPLHDSSLYGVCTKENYRVVDLCNLTCQYSITGGTRQKADRRHAIKFGSQPKPRTNHEIR